jgi:hypothetical protein
VAGLVDRRQDGQVVLAREIEVLGTAAGRDVDDARSRREVDVAPGDDAMLDRRAGAERVERPPVPEPHELVPSRALR